MGTWNDSSVTLVTQAQNTDLITIQKNLCHFSIFKRSCFYALGLANHTEPNFVL